MGGYSSEEDSRQGLDDDEYEVDCIRAEHLNPVTRKPELYLVAWKGYGELECTWEPPENLTTGIDAILQRWENDKQSIKDGYTDAFDVEAWERRKANAAANMANTPPPTTSKQTKSAGLFMSSSDDESSQDDKFPTLRKRKATTPPAISRMDRSPKKTKATKAKASPEGRTKSSSSKKGAAQPIVKAVASRKSVQLAKGPRKLQVSSDTSSDDSKTPEPTTPPVVAVPAMQGKQTQAKDVVLQTDSVAADTAQVQSNYAAQAPNERPSRNGSIASPESTVSPAPIDPKEASRPLSADPKATKATDTRKKTKNIFTENEAAPKPRKTRDTGDMFYAPSHLQNIRKKNENGLAPDARDLVLQTPGEMGRRPSTYKDQAPPTPTDAAPSSRRQSNLEPEAPKESSPLAQTIPLICYHYRRGQPCPEGDGQCRFLHQADRTIEAASLILHQQLKDNEVAPGRWFKFSVPAIVCAYHFAGSGCFRSVEECVWAHWKPETAWNRTEWKWADHQTGDRKTCLFWASGNCRFSAQDCKFAHERLDEVADLGGPRGDSRRPSRFEVMCIFYYEELTGKGPACRNGVGCKFAHDLHEWVASPPGSGELPRKLSLAEVDSLRLQKGFSNWAGGAQGQSLPDPADMKKDDPISPIGDLSLRSPMSPGEFSNKAAIQSNMENVESEQARSPLDSGPPLDEECVSNTLSLAISLGSWTIHVRLLNIPEKLLAILNEDDEASLAAEEPRIVLMQNFKKFVAGVYPMSERKTDQGSVVGVFSPRDVAELADYLDCHESGLLLEVHDMIIFLYPVNRGLLDKDEQPYEMMAYEILGSNDQTSADEWVLPDQEPIDMKAWLSSNLGFDMDDMFKCRAEPFKMKSKDVCLVFGDDQKAESKVLTECFREADMTVWLASEDGAWQKFISRGEGEGVVILGNQFREYNLIPNLVHVLTGRYNVFELDEQPLTGRMQLTQLFDHETMVYLTDELIIHEPEKAVEIVKHVKMKNEGKVPGFETWRIFARPGVVDWILDLLETKLADQGAVDLEKAELYHELHELQPDPEDDCLPRTGDYHERVIFEPFFEATHAEDYKNDPDAASISLLKAFNLTFHAHREDCRMWIVAHPTKDLEASKQWKEDYQNLWFMTPETFKEKIASKG